MRPLTCSLGLLLLAACSGSDDGTYLASFSFSRVAPEGLQEVVLSEKGPAEDSAGLHVRYGRESRVELGDTEPDVFARDLAAAVAKDLESRGFDPETVNSERCIYFVKYESPASSGSVFIHARVEAGEGVRLIFNINENEKD